MKTAISQLIHIINWKKSNTPLLTSKHDLNPLNPLPMPKTDNLQTKEEIYKWIEYGIGCFREWYQPVDFGNGIAAHVTRPPDWLPKPELLYAIDGGKAKWDHVIKKHIPDIRMKRVLDLGCSSGVFSIELARMGASEVIGIDRNELIKHKSTEVPPSQDVISQATFVKKAFELLDGIEYPIKYIAHDIGHIQELNLGRFDVILALCVVYHELDKMPDLIQKLARMTDHLILQASQGHTGQLGEWADKMCQAKVLFEAGFTHIEIESPVGSLMPMIIGRKGQSIL